MCFELLFQPSCTLHHISLHSCTLSCNHEASDYQARPDLSCVDQDPATYVKLTYRYYRPPTKLREDNVFSYVCLPEVPRDLKHEALELTVQPPSDMGPHSTGPQPQLWPTLLVTSCGHHLRPV